MYWMLKSEVIFKGRSVLKQGWKEKSGKFQCRGEYSFNTLVRSCRTGNILAAWIGQRCYCSALRDVSREGSQVWASANWGCHVCGVGTDQRSRGFLCAGWLEKVQPQMTRKTGISVKRWSWCWGSQRWIFVQNFGRIGKNWLKNCHVRKRAGSFRAGGNIPSTLVENWLIYVVWWKWWEALVLQFLPPIKQSDDRKFSQQGFTRRGQVKMGSRG